MKQITLVFLSIVLSTTMACAKQNKKSSEFRKAVVTFSNGRKLKVEVADTDPKRQKGLMNRNTMGKDEGMLFIFPYERVLMFWMKNTHIPLSIGYFDKNKKLFKTMDMDPEPPMVKDHNLKSYWSGKPGLYAIEVNKGWFKKNKIAPGTTFSFQFVK